MARSDTCIERLTEMSEVSSIFVNNTTFDIKDATARNDIASIETSLSGKEDASNKTTTVRPADQADNTHYPTEKAVASAISSSTGAEWGAIAGDLEDQTDLTEVLSAFNYAQQDHEQRLAAAENTIPSDASYSNKLVTETTMNDAISSVEAKQLYKTASQGSFATKAQLTSASTFYDASGNVATPTKNDVAYVLADESHDGKTAKYVIASIVGGTITWGFVITFSDVSFSQTQMDAINSGINATKRGNYDTHISDSTKHVTSADKTAWNSKVADVKVDNTSVVNGSHVANLGALAGKSSASGNYTPAGTVSLNPTNVTFDAVSSVGTLPTWSATVANETLSFSFTQGSLPTTSSKTAVGSASPTFGGTAATIEVS